jgi:hypothetical protein
LEKAAALRRDRGDQIRTSFLWGQAHVSRINERPVAKAIPNSKAVFRSLKAPAPSV